MSSIIQPNYSVNINRSLLAKAARDEKTSEWLEHNLSLIPSVVDNLKPAAAARGSKVISCNIRMDGYDNMTTEMVTQSEADPGTDEVRREREGKVIHNTDSVEISAEGRLASQMAKNEADDENSEKQGGKVAVNEGKRARQIAAAANKGQVQQVIALLQQDMSDCKAGLEQGMCDEAEIAKVEALLSQAKARLSQVPKEEEDPQGGLSAFELASLM